MEDQIYEEVIHDLFMNMVAELGEDILFLDWSMLNEACKKHRNKKYESYEV